MDKAKVKVAGKDGREKEGGREGESQKKRGVKSELKKWRRGWKGGKNVETNTKEVN